MERALIALCGLLTNAIVGGPNRWYRVFGIGKLARIPDKILRDVERRLNRAQLTAEERETRGQIVTASCIVLALVAGFIVGALLAHDGGLLAMVLMFSLPVRPIFDRAHNVRKELQAKQPEAARRFLDSNWRHAALLDEHGVARAAIETLSIGFSEKIVAPVFWYVCLGLPGLFITLSVNVLQEILPRPNDPNFSKSAVWAYNVWHILPSRFAALLWIAASLFLPARDIMSALKGIGRQLPSATPQMLALASAASVLKLSLGGPASAYGNHVWQEMGTAKALPGDIRRAEYLFALLNVFVFVLLGVIA